MKKLAIVISALFLFAVMAYSSVDASSDLASASLIKSAYQSSPALSVKHIGQGFHKNSHKNQKMSLKSFSQSAGESKDKTVEQAGGYAGKYNLYVNASFHSNELLASEMLYKDKHTLTTAHTRK